jgi:hypothetical protein
MIVGRSAAVGELAVGAEAEEQAAAGDTVVPEVHTVPAAVAAERRCAAPQIRRLVAVVFGRAIYRRETAFGLATFRRLTGR